MRRTVLGVLLGVATTAATLLPAGVAQADWPTPVASCPGTFQLQTLNPYDVSYDPDSPAHKDRNADGWLCYNGHAWKDNNIHH
jgi:hypothetical protein